MVVVTEGCSVVAMTKDLAGSHWLEGWPKQ
jgi:hypothetical protein